MCKENQYPSPILIDLEINFDFNLWDFCKIGPLKIAKNANLTIELFELSAYWLKLWREKKKFRI